jgi:Ca2+-binding RTX toxin-like protein
MVTLMMLVAVFAVPAMSDPVRNPQGRSVGGPGTEARARPGCTITGTNAENHLHGTDAPDVICARGGDDRVRGMGGDDVLFLGPGDDTFHGGPGDDRVLAGRGHDFGGGGPGDDRIFLQRGQDIAEDWRGVDLLVGGTGGDALCVYDVRPNAPRDRVRGGPGPDYAGANPGDVVRSAEIVFYGGCWD